MAQKALTAEGGKSPMVGSRVPPAVALRLARLAARRRLSTSAMIREAPVLALDQLERAERAPP
jgi:hypothetical protein